jgi:acetylornithine deacetylase
MTQPRPAVRQMIDRLIAFDTTSELSNLALIDWVEGYFAEHGVPTRRTFDASGAKANLFATVGPEIAGGIVLSGHSDVVPVAGQDWDSDPFQVVERDGRLYGRGTSDMKSFLAAGLALVPEMLSRTLSKPIHFAISYDEELGCIGVGGLIADLKANLPPPALVLIGEPTDLKIVNAHKGVNGFRTAVTGRPAHSSQPQRGASAIVAAARLISFIDEMARERKAAPPADTRFEPPYTSFQVGEIEGGTALNIIPAHCTFKWEFRAVPGDDIPEILARFERFAQETVLPELREVAPEANIVTESLAAVTPLAPEAGGAAEQLLRRLTGQNATYAVAFGTEGGLFQDAGFSTVVCGPGSIDQAHQPNEFIEISQVVACETLLRKIIDWAAA